MRRTIPSIGIDEVGRGAWAGPFVACALFLDKGEIAVRGVRDSKLLTPMRRENIAAELKQRHQFGIGIITVEELNTIGLGKAQVLVFERAVASLVPRERVGVRVLIDGRPIRSHPQWHAIIDGDQKEYSIAAASIIAKVARDAMMRDLHTTDSRYRFDLHKGYGTALHQQFLLKHGPSVHHRSLFEPIRRLYKV